MSCLLTGEALALDAEIDAFLLMFPEFDDAVKYPRPRIGMYIRMGVSRVSECAWGDDVTFGRYLFVAHFLATYSSAGAGGVTTGEVSSKKVGDVQVSYATTSNRDNDAGWWNGTIYGQQWWNLFLGVSCGAVTQLI